MHEKPLRLEAPGVRAEGRLLEALQNEVAQLMGRPNPRTFPGAQPVSFARRHLDELTKQDYYLCEKSDGVRYLMYCTHDNGREVIYLIDRRNDYWYVEDLHFPVPGNELVFHKDTIIDGELVIDTLPNGYKQTKYLVFDCICIDRQDLMKRTLDKRLAYFREQVFKPYSELYKRYPDEIQHLPFIMELKSQQFGYGIEMMFRQELGKLMHGNDGLIFTCRSTEYRPGTDPHILKWKPENENTVDFRLILDFPLVQPDEIDRAEGTTQPYYDYGAIPTCNLFAWKGNGNEDEWYGTLTITEPEWSKLIARNEPLDDRVVECYMDDKKQWRFHRFRDDKENGNHISTVESVIESIRDRVTESDLIAKAMEIRAEWKRREVRKFSKLNSAFR